jgi:hypothetical protein
MISSKAVIQFQQQVRAAVIAFLLTFANGITTV